ncbi:ATP-binding protein [Actinomadura rayongensis]|jgi:serine/threonine-protein kinase RsbW|uniref:ATP-binding protein n=1 Tax=Actinomadura rayongensis TaxID=1429076 RepID=A0A6I4W3I3_9ACTN|nr:ATP-binding protein [Actinomadura rayongensis]MXQ65259.1 ATP-binding protein [Actinomadura rayongensis]
MAIVELSFSALPVHVRTARLIVTAVARRSGVEEALLDEVRLAVGEACSRAVEAHRRNCPDEPVHLELKGENGRFEVTVTDAVPGEDISGPGRREGSDASSGDLTSVGTPEDLAFALANGTVDLGLAVIEGLADDVEISTSPKGVQIRMSWPAEEAS